MSVALSVCSTDLIRAIDKGASLALIRLVGEAGDTTVHRVSLPPSGTRRYLLTKRTNSRPVSRSVHRILMKSDPTDQCRCPTSSPSAFLRSVLGDGIKFVLVVCEWRAGLAAAAVEREIPGQLVAGKNGPIRTAKAEEARRGACARPQRGADRIPVCRTRDVNLARSPGTQFVQTRVSSHLVTFLGEPHAWSSTWSHLGRHGSFSDVYWFVWGGRTGHQRTTRHVQRTFPCRPNFNATFP